MIRLSAILLVLVTAAALTTITHNNHSAHSGTAEALADDLRALRAASADAP